MVVGGGGGVCLPGSSVYHLALNFDKLSWIETPFPNVHAVSDVDLLFGVEVDQQASSIDVRVTNQPDILDFFDSSSAPDPVDRDKMEGDDIFNKMAYTDIEKDIFFKEDAVRKNDSTSTHLEKDISFQVNAFKESEGISSEVHAVKDCVDIAIDDADGKKIEEKTDDGDNDEQMGMSARHDEGQDKNRPANCVDETGMSCQLPVSCLRARFYQRKMG
ncbi:hypothetical protein Btru_074739 [Bulinus truncatus]|nr:hypothetical protein Btru_074739 [Bulinus truncatus]